MASIPGLIVPTESATLVVPAATVAEVVAKPADLKPLPAAAPWVAGYFRWRNCPVTLVSFDRIAAGRESPDFSRVCVFHPLPGRPSFDYFAIIMKGEPRSVEISDAAGVGSPPAILSERFVSGAVQVDGRTLIIPDFGALKAAFYPGDGT